MAAPARALLAILALGCALPAMGQEADAPDAEADPTARIWDCAAGEVAYAVTAAPDRLDALVEVIADEEVADSYAIGAVAPFPRFDYSNGTDRFYRASEGVFFVPDGEEPIPCQARAEPAPELDPDGILGIEGASLGGRLRAGPGVEYAPLGLLEPGAPLFIAANTGIEHEGFNWYEIVLDDTTLYHWGGILCADDHELEGMAGRCDEALPEAVGETVLRTRGGNVRSGPGTEFDDIGSIPEGTALTLIANTGIVFQDQPWFEIVFEEGTAYHWGGLICVEGASEGTAFPPC